MSYLSTIHEKTITLAAGERQELEIGLADALFFRAFPDGLAASINDLSPVALPEGFLQKGPPGAGVYRKLAITNPTAGPLTARILYGLGDISVAGAVSLVGSVPLPAGAATAARQDTGNTTLAALNAKLPALSGGKLPVTDPTALPLPAGAATAARQDILNLAMNRGQGLLGAGSAYFEDTTAHSGSWFAITALTSAVFQGITSDIAGLPATLQLGAGQTLFGNFTSLQLTSGKVIAYAK